MIRCKNTAPHHRTFGLTSQIEAKEISNRMDCSGTSKLNSRLLLLLDQCPLDRTSNQHHQKTGKGWWFNFNTGTGVYISGGSKKQMELGLTSASTIPGTTQGLSKTSGVSVGCGVWARVSSAVRVISDMRISDALSTHLQYIHVSQDQ